MKKRKVLRSALALALFFVGADAAVRADDSSGRPQARLPPVELPPNGKIEGAGNLVTIVTPGAPAGALMQSTMDLSTLLDRGRRFELLRIAPIVSRGKVQGLQDVLHLEGVDAGYLQADALAYLKQTAGDVDHKLRYITGMFSERLAILVRPEIRSLEDLAGKTLIVEGGQSGAAITAPVLLDRLGIKAVVEVAEAEEAIQRMRKGDVAAYAVVSRDPVLALAEIDAEGLHLLSIPNTPALSDLYLSARLTEADYPNLIAPGRSVETIAVRNVLAVRAWPEGSVRYEKMARFTKAFFDGFSELSKPGYQPSWDEVSIAAAVPGWTRFKPAQDWIAAR